MLIMLEKKGEFFHSSLTFSFSLFLFPPSPPKIRRWIWTDPKHKTSGCSDFVLSLRNQARDASFFDEFDLNYGRVVLLDVSNREESAKRSEEEDGGKEKRRERAKEEREREKETETERERERDRERERERESMKQTKEK